MSRIRLCAFMTLFALPLAAQAGQPQSTGKAIVKSQDDLPRFSYPVPGTATDLLLADDATFDAFSGKVGADLQAMLAKYDIQDRGTKRAVINSLQDIAAIRGDNGAVLALAAQVRDLEDKPEGKALSSLRLKAMVAAHRTTGERVGTRYRKEYASTYAASLKDLPWAVVGPTIQRTKINVLRQTEQDTVQQVAAFIDPVATRTHQISRDLAGRLIYARLSIKAMLPVKAETIAVLNAYIAANRVLKPDIWPAREVTLSSRQHLTPVNVAIWDGGTELSLFPGQVYTDPHPEPRFDPHGLAFDMASNPTHGELITLTPEQAAAYPSGLRDVQGKSDADAGIDSPEADAFIEKLAKMSGDAFANALEEIHFFGGYYAHGTHIAGIVARGNPAVRLAVARQNGDWHRIPAVFTEALVRRSAHAYAVYVRWFRDHHVRVVNMSWGGGPSDYERVLEVNGVGATAEERKAMARRLFEIDRTGLLQAMQSAPKVLFVSAAGNSDSDTGFSEDVPSTFELANLITVGATDQAGDPANFTSYGKTVRVYANGFLVDSVVPGGTRLRLSGTSMAAPAVVNLAAKILALSPGLKPSQVIKLMVDGATLSPDGKRRVIDPQRSVNLMAK